MENNVAALDAGADMGAVADLGGPDGTVELDASVTDGMRADASDDPDSSSVLRDTELLVALRRDAAATMLSLGYNAARDAMYELGGIEDRNGRVEGVYTGRTVDVDGSRTPGANCALSDGTPAGCAFNTEHIVPRVDLRAAFGDGTPEYNTAEGDLHHLFPSEEQANTARANFDFGETACGSTGDCRFDEGSQLGLPVGGMGSTSCPSSVDPGVDLCVMLVRLERRGDVARAVFYMSMRYGLPLDTAVEEPLRTWHAADLPDAIELERNDAVESVQGNRNPFVDDTTLVDRISDF